ncbi:histidine--tRNA ligase [Thermoleophilum album]|uniref:Histidine--tRNA ligase n=1 Tax=Thermoleophilum album TaxID=29539 RepID=A0A1H6FTF2_THEAL|nr:histidine--tRNA ligase [Thermoleophilum album]SEH14097.1 histidyl-tRNA synthetase [Thermoleophilum album]
MPGERPRAPRGTFDVLPPESERRERLRALCAEVLAGAGYRYVETPVIEHTELFVRGVGEATDIVRKEMFTFADKGGRSLTLRPENTAGICRAYVEHGMHKWPQPVRLWYWGPFFRHEAPQAGRYRQFTQVGAEALGSDDPALDAELILLLREILERAGARHLRLRLASLGSPATRAVYAEELRQYLKQREQLLAPEVRERIDKNPLRAFDSDHPSTRAVMAQAPRLLDRLDADDREHFACVRALLDAVGVEYEVDPTLVRGLDYYTRTVFEFESQALGAQRGVGGGGRYDRLIEELGGPPTAACGWAAGVERILLAAGDQPASESHVDVLVATVDAARAARALTLARELRSLGLRVELGDSRRALRRQLRHADRLGARAAVIVGDDLQLKRLADGSQVAIGGAAEVVEILRTQDPSQVGQEAS